MSVSPVTIRPGRSLPSLFDTTLTSDQTSCLPPGDYRFHVEYKPIDGELDDVVATRSLPFTIVGAHAACAPILRHATAGPGAVDAVAEPRAAHAWRIAVASNTVGQA